MSDCEPEMPVLNRLPSPIFILGSTGTGKSKLAIDLALRFGGRSEIISADSMQVYKGFDILTNKVTQGEMKEIPHHLMSIVDPTSKFDVVEFRNRAIPIVDKILQAGKIPLIVGGTNYYIESILWQVLISNPKPTASDDEDVDNIQPIEKNYKKMKTSDESSIDNFNDNEILRYFLQTNGDYDDVYIQNQKWTSQQLYDALHEIDPERISKLHHNDKRKILRSLQIYFQTGIKHSIFIAEQLSKSKNVDDQDKYQKIDNSRSHLGGPFRYPNSFCFWIQAPRHILKERIEKRVDEMVEKGLQDEIDNYNYDTLRDPISKELDFTRGILQSIGLKEFKSYLQLSQTNRKSEKGRLKFNDGVNLLKIATNQYARRQLKWIEHRFLCMNRRQVPPIYWLDGELTNEAEWSKNVTEIAYEIVQAHLNEENVLSQIPLIQDRKTPLIESKPDDLKFRICEICDKKLQGLQQWQDHINSNRHKKTKKLKAKESNDKLLLQVQTQAQDKISQET